MSVQKRNGAFGTQLRIPLSSVTYPEGDWWIAHCLELDVAAEGPTPSEAIGNVIDLVGLHIATALEEGDIASIFRPAPSEIWKMFWIGQELTVRKKLPKMVDRFDAREVVLA